jgi:hypothetical protein
MQFIQFLIVLSHSYQHEHEQFIYIPTGYLFEGKVELDFLQDIFH